MKTSLRNCALPTVIILTSFIGTHAANATELSIGYNSKYVSEGRNNLADGGIVWVNANANISNAVTAIFAYGNASASATRYDELNLGLEYARSVGKLDYFLGYTRLEFFEDSQSDNEISAGATWHGFESFSAYADVVYSTQANGSFMQVGLETDIKLNEQLNITPYAVITYDYGYASKENNSHNHTGLGAKLSYIVSHDMAVNVIAEHTIGGIDVKKQGGEERQSWLGVYFAMQF